MKKDRNDRIEEILGSLDHCERASAPDFFYTRLKARMEKGISHDAVVARKPFLLRPAFALTALVLVLIINALVIFQKSYNNPDTSSLSDTDSFQSIAAEYSLNDNNTILFDINQEK
jgi:hypothetical protein